MPAGQISGKLNLNGSGWSAAVDKAIRETKRLQDATKQFSHSSVSDIQAASATIRTFSGNIQNNVRAVERFITTIPGVGKALQAAFPVVGALATVGVLARIGEEIYKTAHDLGQIRNVAGEAFGSMTLGAQRGADALRVTNDKLEQQIAILEGKPVNNMALALDEARLRADDLAKALEGDYVQFKKVIEESQKGMFTQLFNKGIDKQLGDEMNNALAKIANLGDQQRKALAAGNTASANDLGQKLRAAQEQALSLADSETTKRKSMVNVGTARQSTYAGVYGDQGINFDAINAFRSTVSSQIDTADQQKRNTADQERQRADEAFNKAQKDLLVEFQEGIAKQKAQFGVSIADELAYWSARVKAFRTGSDQYKTVLMETYRLQAELYQQLTEGKKKFLESAKSDVQGNDILAQGAEAFAKINTEQLDRAAKSTEKYAEEVAKGAEEQQKATTAFEEYAIAMSFAQGTMSALDAATALAAVHQHDHAEAIERVNKALADQMNLINSDPNLKSDEDRQNAIRNATQTAANQRTVINGAYARTQAEDQANISGNTIPGAVKDALARMVQSFTDLAANLKNVIPQTIESLNDDIAKALTGHGSKGDFGKTFTDAGQKLIKTGFQAYEGNILKAFLPKAGKKPTGAKGDPIYTAPDTGQGEGLGGLGPAGNALFRPFIGGKPQAQGGQGGQDNSGGSIWQKLGNAFLPGLFSGHGGGGGPVDYDGYYQGAFAGGGDFMANRPMLVGEEGPEVLTPDMSGHITPNYQLGGGGGGDTHHTTINVTGNHDPAAVEAAVRRALPHAVSASVRATHQSNARRPGGGRR